MLTIVIAILLSILVFIVLEKIHIGEDSISRILDCIICIGIILGLFVPISGYKESIFFEQFNLVALNEQTSLSSEGEIYVQKVNNKYTYSYKEEQILSAGEGVEVKSIVKTIRGNNVRIIEDENCITPVLKVYTKEANKSIWTFALLRIEKEYVFYIPK